MGSTKKNFEVGDFSDIYIGASLALPQRVNLSLGLGRIVWFFVISHTKFQLRTTTRSDLKNCRL